MRTKELEKIADEESNYTIKITFKDEEGNIVLPTAINWWLTRLDGVAVNEREAVSATPASPWYITLSGNDLRIFDETSDFEKRYFLVKAIYDSSYGTDLPLNTAIIFTVRNLKIVMFDGYNE